MSKFNLFGNNKINLEPVLSSCIDTFTYLLFAVEKMPNDAIIEVKLNGTDIIDTCAYISVDHGTKCVLFNLQHELMPRLLKQRIKDISEWNIMYYSVVVIPPNKQSAKIIDTISYDKNKNVITMRYDFV